MNEFEYTREQGISFLDDFLLPRGYEHSEDFDENPSWYKLYNCEDDDFVYIAAIIDLDLTAKLEPMADFGLHVKSYYGELEDLEDETPKFINSLKLAKKEVIKDLDEVYKIFQDTFAEKKPDNIYTLTLTYDDYGQFDENGIPGVSTDHELEYNSLDEALKDFYMSISFNDEDVTLYKGNKDITDEILADETLFKKYYDDEDARDEGHFKYLTYEQSWECIKEYADAGYSESIEKYLQDGIIK